MFVELIPSTAVPAIVGGHGANLNTRSSSVPHASMSP